MHFQLCQNDAALNTGRPFLSWQNERQPKSNLSQTAQNPGYNIKKILAMIFVDILFK